jgi:hypothetical protein
LAAAELNRRAYGFEIKKDFYRKSQTEILSLYRPGLFSQPTRNKAAQGSLLS